MTDQDQATEATETTAEQASQSAVSEATVSQETQGSAPAAEQAAVSKEPDQDPVAPADEPPMPDFRSYHDLPNPNTLRGVQAGPDPHPRSR